MLALGRVMIKDYIVWVTTPVFSLEVSDPKAFDLPYFEVSMVRIETFVTQNEEAKKYIGNTFFVQWHVDILKSGFVKLNLTDRNPLNNPKDKDKLTEEELEFRTEFQSYLTRKDMSMPLVKLSKRHVEELFNSLMAL